jgi:hypothetical protein
MMSLLLAFVVLSQTPDPAADLLKRGWAAVDELGARPELKPRLQEIAASKDPELAWWAGAALADLEARENAGVAWAEPLRVSLSARERGAAEVLRELVALSCPSPPTIDLTEDDRPVTVSFKDAPYFQALDEICSQAGVVLTHGPGGRLQVMRADPPRGPRQYRAGFAVSPLQLVRRTDVTFKEEPESQLNLQLMLRADPRMRILDAEGGCVLVRAEDDTGRSLLKEGGKPAVRVRTGEGTASVQLMLGVQDPAARRIALLRGTITFTLARKTEEIAFGDLAKGASQERESGGVKVVLKKIERMNDEIRAEVELSAKGRMPWPDTENLTLEDGEGRPFQRWGSSMNVSSTGASYRLTFRDRDGLGEARKLRISVVTESYPRRVFFELRGIVLR